MTAEIRALTMMLLGKAGARPDFASDLLSEAISDHGRLSTQERVALRDGFYRIIGMRRRLTFGLGIEAPAPLALWLASEVDAGRMTPDDARQQLAVVDWNRVKDVDALLDAEEPNPVCRFGIRHSLPDWLAHLLMKELGDEADAYARAQNAPPPLTIRANLLKNTREELAAELKQRGITSRPTPFASTGLFLDTPFNLFRVEAFKNGCFEQQDEASQLVAELTAPPPAGKVFDACAGAGGKTLALAALLKNRGMIVATDIDSAKIQELKRRGRRAGVTNVRPIRVNKEAWPEDVQEFAKNADRILCDVPCSGLGVLRRNTDQRWRIPEGQLTVLAAIQRAIASRAAAALQPGARLVYATCSILRCENEDVVAELLAGDPGLETVRLAEILGSERAAPISDPTQTYLKTFPHRQGTDGFFAAVIRRRR